MPTQGIKNLLLMFYYDGQFNWNIPLLLYYPVGVMYKVPFRYQESWIAPELNNLAEYTLKEAVIVMKFKLLEETGNQQYVPIRKVTIVNCEKVGDYCYFYFKLGDFVRYENSSIFQYSQLFKSSLKKTDANLLVQEGLLTPQLPFVSNDQEDLEINNWFRITNLMMKATDPDLKEYTNTVFLKFHSIIKSNSQRLKPIPLYSTTPTRFLHWLFFHFHILKRQLGQIYKHRASKDYWGYRFHLNDKYSIKIIQHFKPDEKSTYEINDAVVQLDLSKESFLILKSSSSIIGHEDVFYFTFNVCGDAPCDSSIIIKPQEGKNPTFKKSGETEIQKMKIHEISIPIQVRHTFISLLLVYVIPIIVFMLGSLLITASTTELLKIPIFQAIKDNSLVRIIELSAGLFFQALGLYILKGKKE